MRKLLKYELKHRILNITALSLIFSIIVVSVMLNYDASLQEFAPLSLISISMAFLSIVVPIIEFRFKMSKSHIDTLYSMPIKRSKIHLVRTISGLFEIIIPYIISYLIFFIWIISITNKFYIVYFVEFFFIILLISLITYFIIIFAFTRANNLIDGLIFILMYAVTLEFLLNLVVHFTDSIHSWNYLLCSPFIFICHIFNEKSIGNYVDGYTIGNCVASISIYFVLAIIFTIIYYKKIYKESPENISLKSDSLWGYKVLIPALVTLISIYTLSWGLIVIYILVFVGGYLLYAIYTRTFRINRYNLMILIGSYILGTIIGVLYLFF